MREKNFKVIAELSILRSVKSQPQNTETIADSQGIIEQSDFGSYCLQYRLPNYITDESKKQKSCLAGEELSKCH